MGLDHIREVTERVLHEVKLDLEWVMEHRTDSEDYLKTITDYDMPTLELDLDKLKPFFHKKMEQEVADVLTSDFMHFVARAFTQSEKVIKATPRCTKHWEQITGRFKRLTFHILQSNIMEWDKL